jgi:YegS/Rv2252/BmrU family lipid kinase
MMAEQATARATRVFVVLNPRSGNCTAEDVRAALARHLPCDDGACQVHEVGEGDDIQGLVRDALRRDVDVVAAAGGDGTVSAVATGLTGSDVAMAIIPVGTSNVLARELRIPIDLDGAIGLIAGPHRVAGLDAMRVDGRLFFTQIGVGIDSLMIRDTRNEDKRRFGRVAYLWKGFLHLLGFHPRRFRVEADGVPRRSKASLVLVANCGIMGQPPFRWGPGIRPDDGRLDVCIIRPRNLLDYLAVAWNFLTLQRHRERHVLYLAAERAVTIESDRPLPVQADGEIVGDTPVRVEAVPGAVRVVVPETSDEPTG